jgi:peptidoglycan/xylan/chitin deacetylase (PgdA/CDA1 family)
VTDIRGLRVTLPAAGLVALGFVCVTVFLLAGSSAPTPPPTPSQIAVASAATDTPTPSPSPSPDITAVPSPTPSPTLPPASSYPIVNSCDPSSVPWAIPVATPAVGVAGSFALHIPILMYHRIATKAEAGNSIASLVVPPETFSAQLDTLKAGGWNTITMATLAADMQAHVKPPSKTFVITIDDGWSDGYTHAFPILSKHGFVATYYMVAGRIDTRDFLSSVELRTMVGAGDEIGDHTMDHVDLAGQSASKLKYEIDVAAARIAQVTNVWPASLAYPSGAVNDAAAADVAACGELRVAVIEAAAEPAASPTPGSSSKASTPAQPPKPTAATSAGAVLGAAQPAPASTAATPMMDLVYETWATRWTIPRLRVTPGTSPSYLLTLLNRYA